MVPSKILFKHGDNSLVPNVSQDYLLGLYFLSKLGHNSKQSFPNWRAAKAAGLNYTDVFTMNGKQVTIGQILANSPLPESLKDYTRELNKSAVTQILEKVAKHYPTKFPDVLNNYKDLGYMYAFKRGSTVSLTDFTGTRSYRDRLLKKYLPAINTLKGARRIDALNKLTLKVQKAQDQKLGNNSNIYEMLDSGSFGKPDSVRQILSMPGVMQDVKGQPIDTPILTSYGEGLKTGDY
jgi:DNA-directed RNA polymerase beta' subunit